METRIVLTSAATMWASVTILEMSCGFFASSMAWRSSGRREESISTTVERGVHNACPCMSVPFLCASECARACMRFRTRKHGCTTGREHPMLCVGPNAEALSAHTTLQSSLVAKPKGNGHD